MFKINNKDMIGRSVVSIVNFEHISHFFSSVSIVDFEQENVSWDLEKNSNINNRKLQNIFSPRFGKNGPSGGKVRKP